MGNPYPPGDESQLKNICPPSGDGFCMAPRQNITPVPLSSDQLSKAPLGGLCPFPVSLFLVLFLCLELRPPNKRVCKYFNPLLREYRLRPLVSQAVLNQSGVRGPPLMLGRDGAASPSLRSPPVVSWNGEGGRSSPGPCARGNVKNVGSVSIIRNVGLTDFGSWSLEVSGKEKKMAGLVRANHQPRAVPWKSECSHSSTEAPSSTAVGGRLRYCPKANCEWAQFSQRTSPALTAPDVIVRAQIRSKETLRRGRGIFGQTNLRTLNPRELGWGLCPHAPPK